jgi:hypothetical protein
MVSSGMLQRGIAFCLLLGLAAGCASAPDADSPVGMKYSSGTLSAVEAATFSQVWRASLAALNDSDITVLDDERTNRGGTIDGRTTDLRTVRVQVRRLAQQKTELRIRVDSFGDSELSHLIFEKVQIALGPR